MKKFKKMMALLVVFVMSISMTSVVAFAANELLGGTEGAPKTITITSPAGAEADDTFVYEVFKVFDATSDGKSESISYKLMDNAETAPDGFTVDDSGNVYLGTISDMKTGNEGEVKIKVKGADVYLTPQSTELTDEQIKAIQDYEYKKSVGTITITGMSQTKTVTVPDYGYYFITTTTGTVVMIDSTSPAATVKDKNTVPTLDKDIESVKSENGNHAQGADNEAKESATATVGDTVNYTVKITAQKGAEGYVYHDILSKGLTLVENSEPVITAGDGNTILAKEKDYVLTKFNNNEQNGSKDNIIITFTPEYLNKISVATEITIQYSAIINENAVVADTGNKNTGFLEYGHDGSKNSTPEDEPVVYTYEFQLVKDNSSKTILDGAEFELYADGALTKKIEVVKDIDGNYVVKDDNSESATATVIEAGTPKIIGLGNGTYYLKETKAPEGYNLLNEAVPVIIDNGNKNATIEANSYVEGGIEVINNQGAELPSTGGIGTTIFYIIGAVLVIGAGILLVTRRRMKAE